MQGDIPTLRPMELTDMASLMRLKNVEGWNQTEEDWALLIKYKSSINLVAILENRIVGTVCAINYSDRVAWIGMMLVDRDYRGRGISKLLLNRVIDQMKFCASIKLDATPAGHPVYTKIGFIDELRISRMTHPLVTEAIPATGSLKVEAIGPKIIPEIISYDGDVFGALRQELLLSLANASPELGWYLRDGKELSGFCLGRAGTRFIQIGPVYASSDEVALALISAALGQIRGKACVVDVHTDKQELVNWLNLSGFTAQREFKRMYLDTNPYPGEISKQYLICGPEFA